MSSDEYTVPASAVARARQSGDHAISLLREIYGSNTVVFHKGGMCEPGDYARSLLGQQVRLVIEDDHGMSNVVEGQLLGFGEGGDFEILEDDGLLHYGWPLLRVEPR